MIAYCKCEKCGSKVKVDTSTVLTSLPPLYKYECMNEKCKHHGYVLTSEVEYNTADSAAENLRNIYTPDSPDYKNSCYSCTHQSVCRFKEEYEKKTDKINIASEPFIRIKLECIYYSPSGLNISYTRDIRNNDITSNPCSSCEFMQKLAANGGVYVGDSPCNWCASNPYKLTCQATSTSNKLNNTPKATNKTVINENVSVLNTNNKIKGELT